MLPHSSDSKNSPGNCHALLNEKSCIQAEGLKDSFIENDDVMDFVLIQTVMNKKTRNTVHNNRQVRIRETPEALQAGLSLKLLQPRKNQSHLVSDLWFQLLP